MRRFTTAGPALLVLVVALGATIVGPGLLRQINLAEIRARVVLARAELDQPENILEAIDETVRDIAESVEPSVVHIEVQTPGFRGRGSSGSGWVWDEQGHLVTNAHVVSDARNIRVEFADGYVTSAELLASDPFTDIAVLKIDPHAGLIPALRATGKPVRKGERIFAFGSPFGFKFSMSEGIVSGLGRSPRTGGPVTMFGGGFTNFIQTDAAVNPGNSGGPIVDVRGRVVGMNVAIATGQRDDSSIDDPSSQSAGISFAIPLNVIESVVMQLIDQGLVRRGFLGISGFRAEAMVDGEQFFGRGIFVNEVVPNGAAQRAGVRDDDIIARIDGTEVRSGDQLRSLIASANPGEDLTLTVFRSGRFIDLAVQLDERPVQAFEGQSISRVLGFFGVEFAQNNAGVRVERLLAESRAVSAGLKVGQTIVDVEGEPVSSLDDFYDALRRRSFLLGQPVEITLRERNGTRVSVTLWARR